MDKKRENEMRRNARRIFEENLNYDIQFSKILSKLEKVLQ
jgi:hypothetical protein